MNKSSEHESHREIFERTVELSRKESPELALKHAITSDHADAGAVNAMLSIFSKMYPESREKLHLIALVYAPDAMVRFGGDSKQAISQPEVKYLYDVYGNIIGRIVKLEDGSMVLYDDKGRKLGYLLQLETEATGVLATETEQKKKFILSALPSVDIEVIFGSTPLSFDENGNIVLEFTANFNFIASAGPSFTANTTLFGGSIVLQPTPSEGAASQKAANDAAGSDSPTATDAANSFIGGEADLKMTTVLSLIAALDLPDSVDINELMQRLVETSVDELVFQVLELEEYLSTLSP